MEHEKLKVIPNVMHQKLLSAFRIAAGLMLTKQNVQLCLPD